MFRFFGRKAPPEPVVEIYYRVVVPTKTSYWSESFALLKDAQSEANRLADLWPNILVEIWTYSSTYVKTSFVCKPIGRNMSWDVGGNPPDPEFVPVPKPIATLVYGAEVRVIEHQELSQ